MDTSLKKCIRLAGMAPSSHNTQPWIFTVLDRQRGIELHMDRTRALPVNDPDNRELVISCGCALLNLRVALAAAGFPSRPDLLPGDDDPDLLARIDLSVNISADSQSLASLADSIGNRRTFRKKFSNEKVSAEVFEMLKEAALLEGASLKQINDASQVESVAGLVEEGDRRLWADPAWRKELSSWMKPSESGDGIAVPALLAPIIRTVMRRFNMGKRTGVSDRRLVETAPLLVILETSDDGVHDWLCAGQALQRVLLAGCRCGVQFSYLNQPCQVPNLRPRLQSVSGKGVPQLLLRGGVPCKAPVKSASTNRRQLSEILRYAEKRDGSDSTKV
jgi:hypothetical protein